MKRKILVHFIAYETVLINVSDDYPEDLKNLPKYKREDLGGLLELAKMRIQGRIGDWELNDEFMPCYEEYKSSITDDKEIEYNDYIDPDDYPDKE